MIKEVRYLASPYLLELPSRSNTALEDALLCANNIVHPEKEMARLLKILKLPSVFDDNSRLAVLKKLVVMLENQRINNLH